MHVPLRSLSCAVTALLATLAGAEESSWPRRVDTDKGALTIYQPQPEKLEGARLEGRTAASLQLNGRAEPTFGVLWFTAQLDTDRDAGTAVLRDIVVTAVRWPDSGATEEAEIARFLTDLMPSKSIPIALEQLAASLATAEVQRSSEEGLKHDPPQIIVVEELAELLLYDDEPRSMPIPDSDLEHVVNSSFAVVKRKRKYYMSGGTFWYEAKDPLGPWKPIDEPPAAVAELVPADTSEAPAPAEPPAIVVATEPTELIATDGPPAWRAIGTGELMYVANTETPVVREVATGTVFVLLSGRWYAAETLAGPWAVVRPDRLPPAFAAIPPDSELGAVRVSVAGTPEAEEAMLDAHVPQTAAIERSKATLEVRYDGEPRFERIEGTAVDYAVNTAAQVLRIGGKYYACDDGVWFVADSAHGTWSVADSVPMEEIEKIPPSEPMYNVTNVTVYESTPEVVYVGYTPGYVWSYPWYGVPVYGTGWHYPPYWGSCCYYPGPATFGMHVSYNPYTGWGMGFTYSTGFLTIGIGFGGGYGGYYRPGYPVGPYYRPPAYYPPGGYRGPYYAAGQRPGTPRVTPYAGDGRVGGVRQGASGNLYDSARNQSRVAPAAMQRTAGLEPADRAAAGANNVYADRTGNVYRQTEQGWQSREQGRWQGSSGTAAVSRQTPSQGSASRSSAYRAPADLGRDYGARQYGASRSMSRGMPRGGGFGRR